MNKLLESVMQADEMLRARKIPDAMSALRQLQNDYHYIVQPDAGCRDRMVLLRYIERLEALVNEFSGYWRSGNDVPVSRVSVDRASDCFLLLEECQRLRDER